MKVACVTPYYRESREILERCLQSVARQTRPCAHYLVSDGDPQDWIDELPVRHLRLDENHADYGNTPRTAGGLLAARLRLVSEYDAPDRAVSFDLGRTLSADGVGRSTGRKAELSE